MTSNKVLKLIGSLSPRRVQFCFALEPPDKTKTHNPYTIELSLGQGLRYK